MVDALEPLEIHTALKESILKLYGFKSNEKGIQHARLDSEIPNVGLSESLLILGLRASLASFIGRERN